jgi:predicted transcriptional regulator
MRDHGTIAHWMTRQPLSVAVDCSIRQALGLMRGAEVRHLLVVDGS